MASSSSRYWKPVDVGLSNENDFEESKNHYDDTKLVKRAKQDLEADPGEDVAMFFGLEVIDGSDYQVITKGSTKKFVFREEKPADVPVMTKSQKGNERKRAKLSPDGGDGTNQRNDEDETAKPSSKEPVHKDGSPIKGLSKGIENDDSNGDIKPKKKKTKKKKPKDALIDDATDAPEVDPIKLSDLQNSWMSATGGVVLNDSICEALLKQNFQNPTPIQAATLSASILGRRNIVGAAPTGSGKTLAYLLPILQDLREEKVLQALILTPTRELALQVSHECSKLAPKCCGTLVGGLSLAKQTRVLTQRPPILVATAGRLWDLMSSKEHTHLNELAKIRFLVVDEADRMVQQGSFPQLVKILDAVHDANPLASEDEGEDSEDDEENEDRMSGLPGIRGEAKVVMLDDIMEKIKRQEGNGKLRGEEPDVESTHLMSEHDDDDDDDKSETDRSTESLPVNRQTFVFSATLTLPPSNLYTAKGKKEKKGKTNTPQTRSVDGAIAEILEKTRSHGKTKVVDLTSSTKYVAGNIKATTKAEIARQPKEVPTVETSRLPPGLSLLQIPCTQKHKDSHLYAYLLTTAQGGSGPCLVFCNSIAGVRRVGSTLQMLKLPVRMLHANMAQKARFKAVESIQKPKSRDIVVATDIAARGLDIPSVSTVVHYDVARQVDTFIHRAGRTARGMGAGAVGTSISLVAPGEDKAQDRICKALGSKRLFQGVSLDGRLLAEAQVRVNLASKIVECEDLESKTTKQNHWFQKLADEAGLEVDDGLIEEGLAGGDKREQQQLRTAVQARSQLRLLLAQPMTTQRFGKFLSTNNAAAGTTVAPHVVPLGPHIKNQKRKRR